MRTRCVSAVLTVAFAAAVFAQDKPSFAGTWKVADSFNKTTIAVEGNKMTVTLTLAGNPDPTVYLLDGTPSTKSMTGPGGKPIEHVYTSRWEGQMLVTTIATGAPSPMLEKRWLDADGTMKVERTIVLPGNKTDTFVQVFEKVGARRSPRP